MRWITMELIDVGAHQFGNSEIRQGFSYIALSDREHFDDGLIHINNIALIVGNHDVRGDIVERDLDT